MKYKDDSLWMTESDISSKTLDQHLSSFTVTLIWAKHLDTAVSRKVVGKKHKDARENPKGNVGSFQVTDFLDLRILAKSEKT